MVGLIASALALTMRDGVAVRRGFRDRIGAEHAGLPAAIVDDDRLLDEFRHALADHAGDDVVGAAGRKRHDQPDRLGRKLFRRRRKRDSNSNAISGAREILMEPFPRLIFSMSVFAVFAAGACYANNFLQCRTGPHFAFEVASGRNSDALWLDLLRADKTRAVISLSNRAEGLLANNAVSFFASANEQPGVKTRKLELQPARLRVRSARHDEVLGFQVLGFQVLGFEVLGFHFQHRGFVMSHRTVHARRLR